MDGSGRPLGSFRTKLREYTVLDADGHEIGVVKMEKMTFKDFKPRVRPTSHFLAGEQELAIFTK